jgi:hypothetical protein
MHPSNRALTWSGVGPKPDWVNAWLVTGGTLYALESRRRKTGPEADPRKLQDAAESVSGAEKVVAHSASIEALELRERGPAA